jgi:hypothetical protein
MKRNHLYIALSGVFALSLVEPKAAHNTLTGLIPTVYEALDVVSRELIGFIPAVNRDSGAERAAKDQEVKYHRAPSAVAEDVTPGTNPPDSGDQTFGNDTLTISKVRAVPFRWTGEEVKGQSHGITRGRMQLDQIIQAFRTLANEVESDVADVAYKGASRAYGTPGTAPFATANDLSDTAQPFKILDDNGSPKYNRHMVLGSTAMANLRAKQSGLFKVNEAGTAELLRDGTIARLQGFGLNDSAQVKTHTKGTGAGYTTTAAGFAVGTTSIPIITGAGTVLAGDVVTFAGDTNKYVVKTGVAAPGTIVLAAPGLRQAIPAAATAMTIGNSYAANVAFCRHAIALATRLPALPEEGDMAHDRTTITDPVSGLVFELAMYKQYRRVRYEVALAWGQKAIKSDDIVILQG